MFEKSPRPKKRLFLALVLISILLLSGVVYLLWNIMTPGLQNISSYLPEVVGGLILFLLVFSLFAFFLMALAVAGVPLFRLFQGMAWNFVNVLFPLAVFFGRLFNIGKERIERSFIALSNHLFQQKKMVIAPERLLLLLPHCLQRGDCPYKITQNIDNCRQCGGCRIGDLLRICRAYGVNMTVVPGGTLARKAVMSIRPKAVLAVACERDLTSGIQDVFPLPVFGVLNERPDGPCFNTMVDTQLVEKAIRRIIGRGDNYGETA
ncbi:MAG: DUF116 domain-containing protein [Acidaminococcales bacterium]|jgi:hypothetical protein|nr:DUF116 domain-containing protein [Acidaminococcales bacterium]